MTASAVETSEPQFQRQGSGTHPGVGLVRVSTFDPAFWASASVAATVRLINGPLTVDDAFITFRYARNIAEGVGFAYNPGEAVLGTTTPLWTLLLAAAHWSTGLDLPLVALGLNATFDAVSAGVLFVLVLRLGGGRAVAAATSLLFATAPMSVAYAAGGMEASLFVLLLSLAGLSAASGRWTTALAIAGAATLVRPEGLLAGALLLAADTSRQRMLPLKGLAAYLAPLAPWVVFAMLTFGSPLPQSIVAKAGAYETPALANLLALALQPGLPGLSLFLLAAPPPLHLGVGLAAALVAGSLALFAWSSARRLAHRVRERGIEGSPRLVLLVGLFALGYAAAYAVVGLGGVRLFHWYLVPLVPFYCALLALAAHRLSTSPGFRAHRWLAYVALAMWWIPGYGLLVAHPTLPSGFSIAREQLYTQVAQDYRSAWESETVVAAPEIGALGYHSRARILDTVGLISPEAARFPALPSERLDSDNAVSPALIRMARPDYVVSLDQFVRHSLLRDPSFGEAYQLVEARPARVWSSQKLLIFRRADSARAERS